MIVYITCGLYKSCCVPNFFLSLLVICIKEVGTLGGDQPQSSGSLLKVAERVSLKGVELGLVGD